MALKPLRPCFWPLRCLVFYGVIFALPQVVLAQLRPIADDTLGNEGSIVSPDTVFEGLPINQIDGGAQRGPNLFHSFQEFNVDAGRGVYFANPEGIDTILTRVTGGNPSQIFGTLGVLGNTDLFLINPNGVFFGPDARLDIRGSFLASTAQSLRFPDGSELSATNPQVPPLLSIDTPPGLQAWTVPVGSEIVNRGNLMAGQDLTLEGDRLDLQGQLIAGGDLALLATDRLTAQDSPTSPFVVSAGGDLLMQGNQAIEINALSHPTSGLFSGGNLLLRSNQTVSGDAHFSSGGNFSIERLDGTAGNLFSPRDPIIFTNGDVELGGYTGTSLHILAGGSVTLSDVTITGPGDVATTINPNNTTLFNGSRTYADLATFDLTEYEATLNDDGSVSSVDPVAVPIVIDGSAQATLDVRAGVDWAALGGLPTGPVVRGTVTPLPTYSATTPLRADITIEGTPVLDESGSPVLDKFGFPVISGIQLELPGGLVLLTNQFSPNALPGAITIEGNVEAGGNAATVPEGVGGDIRVYGRENITIESPNPPGKIFVRSPAGPAGIAGNIFLGTLSGNITLSYSDVISDATVVGNNRTGNGGAISFTNNTGDINLTESNVFSNSNSSSRLNILLNPPPSAGDGGAISFTTNTGNINLENSASDSYSRSGLGSAGSGGAI